MARHALVAVWLACATLATFAQSPAKPPAAPLVDQHHLVMDAEEVAPSGVTHVFGDPAKPGMYVLRVRLAPGTKTRPRYYDHDRWVTVMKVPGGSVRAACSGPTRSCRCATGTSCISRPTCAPTTWQAMAR